MALALSAHTPRVQLSVYTVSTCWHAELGCDTPGRYLASAGTPVNYYYSVVRHMMQAVDSLQQAYDRH